VTSYNQGSEDRPARGICGFSFRIHVQAARRGWGRVAVGNAHGPGPRERADPDRVAPTERAQTDATLSAFRVGDAAICASSSGVARGYILPPFQGHTTQQGRYGQCCSDRGPRLGDPKADGWQSTNRGYPLRAPSPVWIGAERHWGDPPLRPAALAVCGFSSRIFCKPRTSKAEVRATLLYPAQGVPITDRCASPIWEIFLPQGGRLWSGVRHGGRHSTIAEGDA
jgi:hypothetical protein